MILLMKTKSQTFVVMLLAGCIVNDEEGLRCLRQGLSKVVAGRKR